ncbi:MAG: glycine dehydrogenase subunit 2 [Candidatus Omnitrophica bacterium]|nr:glycine dehydrogenase subunit 2 [Candidatus Omnitrophota bacterium]
MGETIFDKNTNLSEVNFIAKPKVPLEDFPVELSRSQLPLPSLGELDVIRHYSNLAKDNLSVDTNFYPLGSCTMKYNPKLNEAVACLDGFCDIHPYQDQDLIQGSLELMYNLQNLLCQITGMEHFTLQPSSGAHGELAGMLMIRKYHDIAGNQKEEVIVPDSAHGTNPATVSMCGYKTIVVESGSDGLIDIEKLRLAVNEKTAAIMLTNPNTLGLFEEDILEIAQIIHDKDGFLYYDGANFNALLGIVKPSLMGFDVIHLNLHKTFSTPHGCGGPGAGVVGVGKRLADFLPSPIVSKRENYYLNYQIKHSIGRLRTFYGSFSVLVRAYAYILRLGRDGLLNVSHNAIINANYIKEKLKNYYNLPFPKRCMHEVVFSCSKQKEKGALALDIAKRLMDYGIHPPTMYFPLIVAEALMVEATETESKYTLDNFIDAMIAIDKEISLDLQILKNAPNNTCTKRVDEVRAARFPDLRWQESGD